MGTFRTVLWEGLFYERDGQILSDQSQDSLDGLLNPLIGEDIHLAVQFVPPLPIDPDKWGGGCCMWQPSPCPAGHHLDSTRLLNVAVRGTLERRGSQWLIHQLDGKTIEVPFHLLPGHHGRVAAASVFDVQGMRDSLQGLDPDQIESIGVQAADLRDMLARLKGHLKRG